MKDLNKLFASKPFVLASSSPRRKQLLELSGVQFLIDAPRIDETLPAGTSPAEAALYLAQKKAETIAAKYTKGFILGADTIVIVDNCIFGKPVNEQDAARMLHLLSDREHDVITGYALLCKPAGTTITGSARTKVYFKRLSDTEISDYVATKMPMDKAGAYGIQDSSAIFVDRIEGCFYNVVGFPLSHFYQNCMSLLNQNENQ